MTSSDIEDLYELTEQLMFSTNVLAIEKSLAVAHQALRVACIRASELRDLSLHDDLQLLLLEVERFQEDLLKQSGRRRKALKDRTYLYAAPRDDSRPAS